MDKNRTGNYRQAARTDIWKKKWGRRSQQVVMPTDCKCRYQFMPRTPEKRLQKVGEGGGLTENHGGNSGGGAAMPPALHRLPHANSIRQLTASPPRGSSTQAPAQRRMGDQREQRAVTLASRHTPSLWMSSQNAHSQAYSPQKTRSFFSGKTGCRQRKKLQIRTRELHSVY